uniref:CCHC-type domain-containing protein n=1 Tax=Romanomermis culicivorax TaxID=13658 RepID=A0A915KAI5_ROMCU
MHSTQNCRQVRNSNGNANGNGGNGNGDYGNNNNYRGNGNNYGNGSNRNYGNQNENYENRNYRQTPCQICNRSGHLTTQCRSPCRNCGRTGHKTIHCRQPRRTEPLCICCYCPKHAHPETMQRNYSTPNQNSKPIKIEEEDVMVVEDNPQLENQPPLENETQRSDPIMQCAVDHLTTTLNDLEIDAENTHDEASKATLLKHANRIKSQLEAIFKKI